MTRQLQDLPVAVLAGGLATELTQLDRTWATERSDKAIEVPAGDVKITEVVVIGTKVTKIAVKGHGTITRQ